MAYPPQAAQKQIFPNPHFMPLPGHHCRCLAELRESAVDAINYCSRQLLVPWSIVGHTTWHALRARGRGRGRDRAGARGAHPQLARPTTLAPTRARDRTRTHANLAATTGRRGGARKEKKGASA